MLCMSPCHLIAASPPSFNIITQRRVSTKQGERWWNHGWRAEGTTMTVDKVKIIFVICLFYVIHVALPSNRHPSFNPSTQLWASTKRWEVVRESRSTGSRNMVRILFLHACSMLCTLPCHLTTIIPPSVNIALSINKERGKQGNCGRRAFTAWDWDRGWM